MAGSGGGEGLGRDGGMIGGGLMELALYRKERCFMI